ncbi:MAG TPA: DUF6600 domain-containing protein [Methylomirabilota bacterium]|nr:DUF6600 domain-containing protein [Methylomirabilota bacterium]
MITRSKLTHILTAILAIAFVLACLPGSAAADDDPPARVGRLGYLRGSVSFQPAGSDDWGAAEINRPITIGDKLWSDQDSLAEISLGSAAIRLSSNTAFTILNLDDNVTQISVSEGTVNIHLRRLDPDDSFEVDTPNIAFSLLRPGDYRVEVNENGDASYVTVRGGEGEVTGGGQAFAVRAGQTATITGTDQLDSEVDDAYPNDDFDNWCSDRDCREDNVPRYVSQDMTGYEDLDEYGGWRDVPEYGAMWVPTGVVAGWAPYRYGHWVWISPWGWTWVDDSPWGFAPFHYGRWIVYGGVWGWLPGPIVAVRPVYAPALVAWVGGPGGGAGVAWFPLGPREVFVPPYAVSPRYVTNVNVTNTNVTNVYVTNVYNNYQTNRNVTNVTYVNRTSVTVTSRDAFVSARPVGQNIQKVDPRQFERAPVGTAVGAGVAPQRTSLVAGAGVAKAPAPPARFVARPVVAKRAPPPAPVSFAAQQSALAKNNGKPLAASELSAIRPKAQPNAEPPVTVKIAPTVRTMGAPTRVGKPGQPPPAAAGRPAPANAPRPPAPPPAANPNARPGGADNRQPNEQPKPAPPPKPAETQPPNRPPPPTERPQPVRPTPQPEEKPAPARPQPSPPAEKPQPVRPTPQPEEKPAPARPQPPPPAAKPPAENKPNKPAPEQKSKDDKQKKEKPKDEKDKP